MGSHWLDPRDSGDPRQLAWVEFCAAWASSFLLGRLLREARNLKLLDDVVLEWHKVNREVSDLYEFAEQQGIEPDDEPIPTRSVLGDEIPTLTVAEFEALFYAAFYGQSDDRDVYYLLQSSVVAAHHHSLEQLFKKLSGWTGNGRLPEHVRVWLIPRVGDLSSHLWDDLVLLDASRHCLVHNWGRVDDKFLRAVRNPPVQRDELLPLSERHLVRYANTARQVASRLVDASYK